MHHQPWHGLPPTGQTRWLYCCRAEHLFDKLRCYKVIFKSISTMFSIFSVSPTFRILLRRQLKASCFLVSFRVWVWYFSQAASGIPSSKSSWPAIYSYEDRRSFHSGTQLQMEAIEKSLNLAAVQLHHQTPHAAQLFSLATASSKELFFPDYASVGCLWRPGQCLLKKERKSEQLLLLFSRELYRENSV